MLLLLGSLTLISCSGGSGPDVTPEPEAPPEESVAEESVTEAPAAPESTPSNESTGESTFVSDNFTITITGFGIDAAYKGCSTEGQCLEIPRASSYEAGTYTWENEGYLYMMQAVVGGDYRLEVRDPQGKVLVDERVNAVHND